MFRAGGSFREIIKDGILHCSVLSDPLDYDPIRKCITATERNHANPPFDTTNL